jgi:hypothetical protein
MRTSTITRTHRRFAVGAVAALALLGPPQIHVRAATAGAAGVPAGAALLVEVRHHDDHGGVTVTGRAEGLRSGRRVTQPLTITSTGKGSYALTRQWDTGSPWVLVLSAEQLEGNSHALSEAMVKVDSRGAIVSIDHPRGSIVAKGGNVDRIGEKEVAAALATLSPR